MWCFFLFWCPWLCFLVVPKFWIRVFLGVFIWVCVFCVFLCVFSLFLSEKKKSLFFLSISVFLVCFVYSVEKYFGFVYMFFSSFIWKNVHEEFYSMKKVTNFLKLALEKKKVGVFLLFFSLFSSFSEFKKKWCTEHYFNWLFINFIFKIIIWI